MRILLFSLTWLLLTTLLPAQTMPPALTPKPVTEEYCAGVKVTDPYRNVENLEDPEVKAWMKAQADYARSVLNSIPGRQGLIDNMKDFDSRKASRVNGLQVTENNHYFYYKIRPEDQQRKLYTRLGYEGQEELLFDPEAYEQGKVYSIGDFTPSWDGSKVAVAVSEKGAEIGHMFIVDVASKKRLTDRIENMWGSAMSWLPDNASFLYTPMNGMDSKLMETILNTQGRLHKIGSTVAEDKVVFSAKAYPALGIKPEASPYTIYDKDAKLIYGELATVENYLTLYYTSPEEFKNQSVAWKPLFNPTQEVTDFHTDHEFLYFVTSKSAAKKKLMRMPLTNLNVDKAETLVPESKEEAIEQFAITKDGLYLVRSKNGVQAKLYFMAKGQPTLVEIKLPTAAGYMYLATRDVNYPEVWVYLNGWLTDNTRYRYNLTEQKFIPEPLSSEAKFPEYKNLVVEELMIPSHDGVMVPLSLVYDKNLKKDGNNPVLMEGYGAYAISRNPSFSPERLLWTQQGGIYAVAHVRGGGELGEAWHKAGQKATKPNTWKDLIASAEYLIKNKYTAAKKIAINGGSAGGILIGRAMTERPDLFGAAIPQVGSLNAVRAENQPTGPENTPEFGSVNKPDECMALLEMDAYLHLKEKEKYPATLVTAGFNDPRVIAWEPAKFAARLLACNGSSKPILFFTDYDAGHSQGNSKQKQFESRADVLAFGLWNTGVAGFQVK